MGDFLWILVIFFVLPAIIKAVKKQNQNQNSGEQPQKPQMPPAPWMWPQVEIPTLPPQPVKESAPPQMSAKREDSLENTMTPWGSSVQGQGLEMQTEHIRTEHPALQNSERVEMVATEGSGFSSEGCEESYSIRPISESDAEETKFSFTSQELVRGIIFSEIIKRPRSVRGGGSRR